MEQKTITDIRELVAKLINALDGVIAVTGSRMNSLNDLESPSDSEIVEVDALSDIESSLEEAKSSLEEIEL